MNYIFVYGTLKRGEGNHALLAGTEFVELGYVKGCVLFDMGGCPAMMTGGSRYGDLEIAAKGEIYAVKDENLDDTLARLDKLEGEGELYLRVKLKVHGESGCACECITYLFIPSMQVSERVVPDGWWSRRNNWNKGK